MGKSPLGKKYGPEIDGRLLRYGFITDSHGIIVKVFSKVHFEERLRTARRVRRIRTGGSK